MENSRKEILSIFLWSMLEKKLYGKNITLVVVDISKIVGYYTLAANKGVLKINIPNMLFLRLKKSTMELIKLMGAYDSCIGMDLITELEVEIFWMIRNGKIQLQS